MKLSLAVALIGCMTIAAVAQEAESESDKARRKRLAAMTAVVDAASLQSADSSKTFTRTEHPILRYTNPATSAFGEGVTYLWLDGKRPVAAVSPSLRNAGTIYWELTSLSDQPLRLARDNVVVWKPPNGSRPSAKLLNAPEPAATPAARLTQLRALARRFRLREQRREQWQDGRLLTQPLYRWDAPKEGVVDGALFGFAETTDPEALLLFEVKPSGSGPAEWWFSIAKMTSSPCVMLLDDQEIWSSDGYWKNPRRSDDPYVEAIVGKIDPALLERR